MTTITTSEIKLLVIQLILMAFLTGFMLLYASTSTTTTTPQTSYTASTSSIDATSTSWISNLLSIPAGMDTMLLISLLVISPFLFLDVIIGIRFFKDITTQWV